MEDRQWGEYKCVDRPMDKRYPNPTTLVIDGLEDLIVSTLCFNGLPSWNIGLVRA